MTQPPQDRRAVEGVERSQMIPDLGIKKAVQEALMLAQEAYKMAAVTRASMNPEMESLALHYQRIGEVWEGQAGRILAYNDSQPSTQPQPRRP